MEYHQISRHFIESPSFQSIKCQPHTHKIPTITTVFAGCSFYSVSLLSWIFHIIHIPCCRCLYPQKLHRPWGDHYIRHTGVLWWTKRSSAPEHCIFNPNLPRLPSAEIRIIVQYMQQNVKQASCESVTSAMSISQGSSYLQNSLAIGSFICST